MFYSAVARGHQPHATGTPVVFRVKSSRGRIRAETIGPLPSLSFDRDVGNNLTRHVYTTQCVCVDKVKKFQNANGEKVQKKGTIKAH